MTALYAVTFTDYTPIERTDGRPFTLAVINESDSPTGPWTTIDTITLSPPDTDPANPITRTLTTENATLLNGWYQIIWSDAGNSESIVPPIQNIGATRSYRPQVSDVGELLHARTVDTNMVEHGTFTPLTRPTFEQAERVIDRVMEKLEAKFGPSMKPELVGAAATAVALRAAMMIELSYFGEQIAAGRSPYPQLLALYEEAVTDWDKQRLLLGADDLADTDDDEGAGGLPVYCFPPLLPRRPLIGLGGPDDFNDEDWPGRFGL